MSNAETSVTKFIMTPDEYKALIESKISRAIIAHEKLSKLCTKPSMDH